MTEKLYQPPHAQEAEQSVLGGLMLRPEKIHDLADWLKEEHFYRRDHALIYRAIAELVRIGQTPDAVTLGEWFEAQGIADLVGGSRYILQVANNTPGASNIVAYGEIVAEKAKLRALIDFGVELAQVAKGKGADSVSLVSEASVKLASMQSDGRFSGPQGASFSVGEWFSDFQHRAESEQALVGLPTPWKDVNDATLGLAGGDFIVIGGRSNVGKSVSGFQLAGFTALRGNRSLIFSLETSRKRIIQRQVACIGGVPFKALMNPQLLEDQHWPRITNATALLKQSALLIDEQAGLSVGQIVARAKREHLRAPLSMILVDHLQIVRRAKKGSTADEIGEVTQGLKQLAKDLDVPVVALSQLNRESTKRADRRPTVADLKGSGDIEQDADLVMLLHREDAYPDPHPSLVGLVECIIAKGRDVETGKTVPLLNRYDEMRMEDWVGPVPNLRPVLVEGGTPTKFRNKYAARAA